MTAPHASLCAICGDAWAVFGFGLPGPMGSIPADKRGRLEVCGAPDCKAAGEARYQAGLRKYGYAGQGAPVERQGEVPGGADSPAGGDGRQAALL